MIGGSHAQAQMQGCRIKHKYCNSFIRDCSHRAAEAQNEAILSQRHGCHSQRVPFRGRRVPRRHHSHHSLWVFTRYVLNSAASWPEPIAVLLMIVLSFLSAVVCYREHLHIGVGVLPALLSEPPRRSGLVHRSVHARHQPCSCWRGASSSCRRPGTRASPSSHRLGRHRRICRSRSAAPHRAVRHRAVPDAEVLLASPSPKPSVNCPRE